MSDENVALENVYFCIYNFLIYLHEVWNEPLIQWCNTCVNRLDKNVKALSSEYQPQLEKTWTDVLHIWLWLLVATIKLFPCTVVFSDIGFHSFNNLNTRFWLLSTQVNNFSDSFAGFTDRMILISLDFWDIIKKLYWWFGKQMCDVVVTW